MDTRIEQLAHNLIHYSTALQAGEKILIEVFDDAHPLARALIKEAYRSSALPFLTLKNNILQRELLLGATQKQLALIAENEAQRMRQMDAYIALRASRNVSELADVPAQQMQLYQQYWAKPVHSDIRVPNTKWCVLRWPNHAMAQLANTSTEAFEDFYFNVCNLDYAKMATAMTPLVERLNHADRVRIVGSGTDLTFSVKGIGAVKCSGRRNIPDGEVYTAPVRNSVNGSLSYNVPAVYQGVTYENIRLTFRDGQIVAAQANHPESIEKIFATDDGARFIGEFALGVNPYITTPMKDTLFDEKISGSFHFTPGMAYKKADNGNVSAIHWDLVCIQTPAYGGGEIYIDDRLIRKDGRFLPADLAALNPENLK